MGRIGMPEIIVIALVIMILFGAKKLPEFAKYLGEALNEFKKAGKQAQDEKSNESSESKSGVQS